jgi:hypothetical protein
VAATRHSFGVGDLKPPRVAGDERETLLALLQYQRESVVKKLAGVAEADARVAAVPSGTSLLWLVKHLTRGEALWVLQRFAGTDDGLDSDVVDDEDTVASVIAAYQEGWELVDEVIDRHSFDDVAKELDGMPAVNLRWVLAHLLEETARYAGHADILREHIDGQTGR